VRSEVVLAEAMDPTLRESVFSYRTLMLRLKKNLRQAIPSLARWLVNQEEFDEILIEKLGVDLPGTLRQ
jgi:hypothetical protein